MDIQSKLERIIPTDDFQHRWEFSNQHLVDELDDSEKKEIEALLIKKLCNEPGDILIVETLSYIRSKKALPAIRNSLKICVNKIQRIIIAVSIYKIDQDNDMINVSISAFKQLHNKWDFVVAFGYLKGFNDSRINQMIEEYIDHPDFLISYNAKKALNLI